MICVIQRVKASSVVADGNYAGGCEKGILVMVGAVSGDTEEIAAKMAQKISKMRIFSDDDDKMNYSVSDIGGQALVISNFTLCASCRRGTRPDFMRAEKPIRANELYEYFVKELKAAGVQTETGVFGADMQIKAELDGPVTIVLDSDKDLAKA